MKLFFATDIHGSDLCYRKFLRAPEFYGVDALFLGGDYSSKSLVMCVRSQSVWSALVGGKRTTLHTRADFQQFRTDCWNRGQVVSELDEHEFSLAQQSETVRGQLYDTALRDLLSRWTELACDRLKSSRVPILHIPGNEEPFCCDEFFNDPPFVPVDRRHIEINSDVAVLGLGGSNPTPWKTPREYEEEQIEQFIEQTFTPELQDRNLILFAHVPPWRSGLDEAPALNPDLSYKLVFGSPEKQAIGSRAVRCAIERLQPILGLFGHAHESRGHVQIGRTVCVNPGTAYQQGRLQGCVVSVERGQVTGFQLTEG